MIDFNALGAGVGAIILSTVAWFGGRATNKAKAEANVERARAEGAGAAAETSVVTLMREEVLRLSARVGALESREGKLIRHIYRLEGLMRGAGMTPPHFDLDGDAGEPVEQLP